MKNEVTARGNNPKRRTAEFFRKLGRILDPRRYPGDFARLQIILLYRLTSFPRCIRHGKNSPGLFLKGPGILLMNHTGALDGPLQLGFFWSRRINFLTYKKVLDTNKFLGFHLKLVGCIPLDKENMDYAAVRECKRRLKRGELLSVFPEGTVNRSGSDEMLPFKEGAALLAASCDVPVYPVYCSGHFRPFRRVTYVVGEPVRVRSLYEGSLDAGKLTAINTVLRERMEELQTVCRLKSKPIRQNIKKTKEHSYE